MAETNVSVEDAVAGLIKSQLVKGKVELDQSTIDRIVSTPKGHRPDPSTYLSQENIDEHLSHF